jgi:uncharacterized membrane protein
VKVLLGVLTAVLVVLYPVAIWLGLTYLSARTVGLWILAVLVPVTVYRFRRAARADVAAVLRIPLVIGAVVGLGAWLDDPRFVLATPVCINLGLLLTFGASLRGTPMIERFARMQQPDGLSPAQAAHCRQMTWAWVGFFALNAATAAALAALGDVTAWAAYNGGIAYALMGLMFAAEYLLRKYRFREYGEGLHDRLLARVLPPRPAPREGESC